MTKRRVCVVGAGPGGLVTAKVLLQTGQFDITIFERSPRIGGIWAIDQLSRDGFLSPYTPTNLSRFQVAFSDHAWETLHFTAATKGHAKDIALPMFPHAWQVNQYLEAYRLKYVPAENVHLQTAVTSAKRDLSTGSWTVVTTNSSGQTQDHHFDLLVLASGFFAAPRLLQQVIPHLPDDIGTIPIKIIHSGQFRDLHDLFPGGNNTDKDILVIGGSNSAGEGAGVIAGQLSNAQHSTDVKLRSLYKNTRIVHVTPRPLYALPPYIPVDEDAQAFLPLDFQFYNLAKRLPGPIVAGAGIPSDYIRDVVHDGIQKNIGGDQSDLGASALVPPGPDDVKRSPVQAALTESYSEYVRSGMIKVVRGKVDSVGVVDGRTDVHVSTEDATVQLSNIGAIVYATGYTPIPALDMLDEQTKALVNYDRTSMRMPLILQDWQTSAPAVPELAFHGFYEGPYWGIMENQARLTAHRWLGRHTVQPRGYELKDDLLDLRRAMHDKQLDVPQYWLSDYTGYMEEMALALQLERNDEPLTRREGAVLPARYSAPGDDRAEAMKTMASFVSLWRACHEGQYRARAVFRAMQGKWEISRTIDSKRTSFPSGVLGGTATFHPRVPTSSDSSFDLEYLYIETGTFKTTTGMELQASRRYVYRYSEARDELSVWFVKPDSDYEVDYLFHNLAFSSLADCKARNGIIGVADHLCIKDMYRTEYQWSMKGITLPTFTIKHEVHGPEKDYTAITHFRRPPVVMK